MKTLPVVALAAAMSVTALSSNALAAGPTATLVFEGTVPSIMPDGGHTITGPGSSTLQKGKLSINEKGQVTTANAVLFEVHAIKDDGTVDTATKTQYKVTLAGATLSAGAATVDNTQNVVTVNGTVLKLGVMSDAFSQPQASATFANSAGFDVSKVGAGGIVQANVNIMIEPPTAAPPGT